MIKLFKYTAIITCFNAQNTIKQCINSVLNQNIKPDEIIIVDDSSTDTSMSLLQDFIGVDNVKIVQNKKNLGVAASRNLAMKLSNSNYFIFFDDDDISLPTRTLEHRKHFEHGADLSFVSSTKKYSNYSKKFINSTFFGQIKTKELVRYLNGIAKLKDGTFFFPASTLALSKNVYKEIGGFNEKFRRLEDIDFVVECSKRNKIFEMSSSILVERFYKDSAVNSLLDQKYLKNFAVKYKEELSNKELNHVLLWLNVRDLYFKNKSRKKYLLFLFYFLKHPSLLKKINNILNRMIHDIITKV